MTIATLQANCLEQMQKTGIIVEPFCLFLLETFKLECVKLLHIKKRAITALIIRPILE